MTTGAELRQETKAVFTHGSTMRHVIVMTGTGSVGLMAVFLVDFLSLLYVSWLHDPRLTAAVGFASQVLFLGISINIGLAIALTALVSRALGAGDRNHARRLAASGLVHIACISGAVVVAALPFLRDILQFLGAKDGVTEVAAHYLEIALPANIPLGLGMALAGILRAIGDAKRAMYVTLAGGIVTAFTDPLFIFGFGFGVYGAAIATVISRFVFVAVGFHGAATTHRLLGSPTFRTVRGDLRPMMAIAGPAILTNLATPVGNSVILRIFSAFGPSAIAASAIIDRLTPVAFGILFALTGAVGPIIGQNLGARLFGRVRQTLTDSFTFTLIYAALVWFVLWLLAPTLNWIFRTSPETARYVTFFCSYGVSAWLFFGCLFVANAAFNNLGFPIFSTLFNWGRALGTIPLVAFGAAHFGVEGGQIGVAAGAALFGLAAVATAYFATARLAKRLATL